MNVSALKALYVALGGELTDTYDGIAGGIAVSQYSLISDVILAIAEVAKTVAQAATTAELPEVTAANDGDMLKVVSGKWAKFTPAP